MDPFEFASILLWDVVEPTAFVVVIIMLWKVLKTLRAIHRVLEEIKKCGCD